MNKNIKISTIEMKEIKGGTTEMPAPGDVLNKNNVKTCRCTWTDYSVTINKNTANGCQCICRVSDSQI